MTYECPCGCHIEIADLRRQLAEAQQARERAQVAAIEIAKDRAEIKATLGESHALLRRAQEALRKTASGHQVFCSYALTMRPGGLGPCDCAAKGAAELHAAITAHLKPDTEKTAQDWLQHRFTQAYPDELVRPRLVVIGPAEKLESIRLSVDNPAIPNLSGVRAWIEQ